MVSPNSQYSLSNSRTTASLLTPLDRIAELQADTIVRRYPSTRIASLRIHWSIPNRAYAHRPDPANARKDLWGYVLQDSAADAFLLAIDPLPSPSPLSPSSSIADTTPSDPNSDGPSNESTSNLKWTGHERFFISAPDTRWSGPTLPLYQTYFPHVPLKPGFELHPSSRRSFYDSSKAERLLGWRHEEPEPVLEHVIVESSNAGGKETVMAA